VDKAKQRQPNGGPHLVFHAKKPTFGEFPHPRWPEGYRCVAVVQTTDLEKVFRLTNHHEEDWTSNPGVCCPDPRQRSTSVGDVVVGPDGRMWRCEDFGWSEVLPQPK